MKLQSTNIIKMATLQLNSYGLASMKAPHNLKQTTNTFKTLKPSTHSSFSRLKIRAVGTVPESKSDAKEPEDPPSISFAFVHVSETLISFRIILIHH